ncbi:MAG: rhomboid family intramembrane serine protease [Deltaproteobacteria bacterium]|nr:rhomboid family intramembrane serine protease [Deltaproteobacteria bacterium]
MGATEREGPDAKAARAPFPWVSATLIATAVLVFALQTYVERRWPPKTRADELALTLKFGALFGPSVRDGEWWRMLSFAFAHGSTLHLAFNMMATSALGVPLERRIGSLRFLQLSFVVCLGSAALVLLAPRAVPAPTVGASGIIFGWAGALLFLLGRAQVRELLQMLILNAAISLLPGISWQGHLGGFLFGLPCGLVLRRDPQAFSARAPIFAAAAGALAIYATYR